jgi:hypothetical protein
VAAIIYSLCAALSLGIAFLLWREYGRTRSRVLFWSALCFTGLTLNNAILVLDKLFLPDHDFQFSRYVIALVSLCLLLFGLVYEDE